VGRIPPAGAPPGLAAIHLGDQRQQLALAATDGRVRGVDGRHQMLVGMEIVPAHADTNTDPGEERAIIISNIRSFVKALR
jgi:hypothetical protein